jgi:transcription initiation factor TFIIH subunit 2
LPSHSLTPHPTPPRTWPQSFIREFFDQNPISSVGVIAVRDGPARLYSPLSCNIKRHETAVLQVGLLEPLGDFSLQSALDLAASALALVPAFATREVIVVQGSHTTNDAGNILASIAECAAKRTRLSFVCLPGEVYVSARAARDTGGSFAVPETAEGIRQAMLTHCIPPPLPAVPPSGSAGGGALVSAVSSVEMGFPTLLWDSPGLCACHSDVKPHGFICPRCSSRSCEMPAICAICKLQLVSAASLARSYHHLFPVLPFTPTLHVGGGGGGADASCAGCGLPVQLMSSTGMAATAPAPAPAPQLTAPGDVAAPTAPAPVAVTVNVCPSCGCGFCDSCDVVIHETLHCCPGCAGGSAAGEAAAAPR